MVVKKHFNQGNRRPNSKKSTKSRTEVSMEEDEYPESELSIPKDIAMDDLTSCNSLWIPLGGLTSMPYCPMTGLISPNSTLGALSEGSPSAGPSQEALVRVFKRIFLVAAEADGGYFAHGGMASCRLLADQER
ncbi:hypothetical protein L2E82_33939 [Cichorium intybus]|uniref:Uncharacterized protein n=1 Tax=Cichorium intybus TaxID=13427 RepID=A0ACB9BLD0_CICIN|nr:hypothetical protein L2E82_33939 [Cichorium intybus]